VEVKFSHPPIYDLSKGKELDKIVEQRIEIKRSCEEVEVLRKIRTGYALSRPLEASLPKLSSTPLFEWVKFISISFIVPLEYGLLETDGQLRMLCEMKRNRKMFRGWRCKSRLIMVDTSRVDGCVRVDCLVPFSPFFSSFLSSSFFPSSFFLPFFFSPLPLLLYSFTFKKKRVFLLIFHFLLFIAFGYFYSLHFNFIF